MRTVLVPSRQHTGLLAAFTALLLATSLLPGASATADQSDGPVGARGIDRVCPAPDDATVDDRPAVDDIDGDVHEDAIDCALDHGLVRGTGDGYDPGRSVTRGQMATFVANWIETALDLDLPSSDGDAFPDIADSPHRDGINRLAASGVISGRADGTYGPTATVTRGQMSRFVANAIDYADTLDVDGSLPPDGQSGRFDDAVGHTFEATIDAIADLGIVQGVGGDRYAPDRFVTRGQLATFLMQAADYLDVEQRWYPTAVVVEYEVALSGDAVVDDRGTIPSFGHGADAAGSAELTIDAFNATLDYTLTYDDIDGPFATADGAGVRTGELDQTGEVVVDLASGMELDDGDGTVSGTVFEADADVRFARLVEDPEAFHLDVRSDDFADGAVRGQLPDGGQDLVPSIAAYELELTGEQVVDDSGDDPQFGQGQEDATATATVIVDDLRGVVTVGIDFSRITGGVGDASGLHIHAGEAGTTGEVVVPIATGERLAHAPDRIFEGSVSADADGVEVDLRTLLEDPDAFYLQLSSDDYPGGAVRGQLSGALPDEWDEADQE